jgi:hypothetical protein
MAVVATAGSAQSQAPTSLDFVSSSQPSVRFASSHREPRPGDRLGTGDIITGDDRGFDRVSCTVMTRRDALCTAVVVLSKGTLTAQSRVSLQPGSGVARYAITGGTGAYDGARGTAVVTAIAGTAKLAIHVTLLP